VPSTEDFAMTDELAVSPQYTGESQRYLDDNRAVVLGVERTESKLSLEATLTDAFYLSKSIDLPVIVWRHLESKQCWGTTLTFDPRDDHMGYRRTLTQALTLALSQVHAEFICVVNASIRNT
jgi:hypothetical protein